MMLQLSPPIFVNTPHGEGMALIVSDEGINTNYTFLVALKGTLELRHYQTTQLKIAPNYTFDYVDKQPQT